jgi:hypothetical protein
VCDSDKDGWEMSTKDLDLWDAMLQVCLTRILDDGGDAMHMLDHLVGTISSTHIPTSASAMHIAELIFSHLNVPPDAPMLLRFMNDMLVSTYLPKPWNKVMPMWLICATIRVEDMGPAKKLCDVSWPEQIDPSGQLIASGCNHARLLAMFSLSSRLTLGT